MACRPTCGRRVRSGQPMPVKQVLTKFPTCTFTVSPASCSGYCCKNLLAVGIVPTNCTTTRSTNIASNMYF
eukprot:gene198-3585_t